MSSLHHSMALYMKMVKGYTNWVTNITKEVLTFVKYTRL